MQWHSFGCLHIVILHVNNLFKGSFQGHCLLSCADNFFLKKYIVRTSFFINAFCTLKCDTLISMNLICGLKNDVSTCHYLAP